MSPRDIKSPADARAYAKTLNSKNVYRKFQKQYDHSLQDDNIPPRSPEKVKDAKD